MNLELYRKAEAKIRNEIFSSLSEFEYLGSNPIFTNSSTLSIKEFKYKDQIFYVLVNLFGTGAAENDPMWGVPLCVNSEVFGFDKPESGSPFLIMHQDRSFLRHLIFELDSHIIFLQKYSKTHQCLYLEQINASGLMYYENLLIGFLSFDANQNYKEIYVRKCLSLMLWDDALELTEEDTAIEHISIRIEGLFEWIMDTMSPEIYFKIRELSQDYYLKYSANYNFQTGDEEGIIDQRLKYILDHGQTFSSKALKIIKDSNFEKFLNDFSIYELSAFYVNIFNMHKAHSIVNLIYCYSKKRNDITFDSIISALHETKFTDRFDHTRYSEKKLTNIREQFFKRSLVEKNLYRSMINYLSFVDPRSDKEYLENLVIYGEKRDLEFKASAKFSFDKQADDKTLYYQVIKSICALANTNGGTLIVGYHEKQYGFVGIEKDGFSDNDKWENYVRNHLDAKAGKFIGALCNFQYKKYNNKTICVINVEKTTKSIMCTDLKNPKSKNFYVRTGPFTKSLNIEEAMDFIRKHQLDE